VKVVAFDEVAAEAGLALEQRAFAASASIERDGERDKDARGHLTDSARGRKRRSRGMPPEGLPIAAPARTERHFVDVSSLGLRPNGGSRRRVSLTEAGSLAVKRSSTRVVRRGSGRGGWRSTKDRKVRSRARSRIDQSEGCSCRRSVAEVGEKHLLRKRSGRRKASRDERSSLKRPPRS